MTEALALAARDGVDGLTLRPLAARLDVSAPALYRHVASRGALLGLMVQRLLEQTPPVPDGLPWDEALMGVARRMRDVYGPYPGLAGEALDGGAARDRTEAEAGRLVDALEAGGLARAEAQRTVAGVLRWLLAYLAAGEQDGVDPGEPDAYEAGVELFVAGLRTRLLI